jgi:prepilin-type N-terminal cleavage/methylation domain-containing protein
MFLYKRGIIVKRQRNGLTIIELLAVIAIIAILIGLLIPAVTMVKRKAKETQQAAQIKMIEYGMASFKADFGHYPESSDGGTDGTDFYGGAQKLAEALLGLDLRGFHPDSEYILLDPNGIYNSGVAANLKARKGYYIDIEKANVFKLGNNSPGNDGLFNDLSSAEAGGSYVLCDVFGRKVVSIGSSYDRAGTPILYYRADRTNKNMLRTSPTKDRTYNATDNEDLIKLGRVTRDGKSGLDHWATDDSHYDLVDANSPDYYGFTKYINDGRVGDLSAIPLNPWPHNPDSYLLITAGVDGIYGTADDITNFGD